MCTEIVCCAGREVCSACCACFKCCCKMTMKQQIRLSYVLMNILFFLFAIIVLHYVQSLFDYFSSYIHCPEQAGGKLNCLGVSSVYRISFSLAILYAIILLAVWARNECSKLINEGLWLLKIFFIVGIFIGFMYVDYSFFDGYRDFARIFGAIFLVIQSVMLIDIFYMWGQKWKAYYDEGAQWMAPVLIGTAVVLYGLTITLVVLNFIWFNGCGLNTFINVANLILVIAITVVQLLGYNPHGSLICSGAQGLYMTFLTFSAQLSGESSCNLAIDNNSIFTLELVVGLIILIVVQLYLTFGTKESSQKRIPVSQNVELNGAILADKDQEEESEENDIDDEENGSHHQINKQNKEPIQQNSQEQKQLSPEEIEFEKYQKCDKKLRPYIYSNTYIIFHIVMLTSSVYGSMLLTNWGSPDMNASTFNMYKPSESSYWVKIVVSWASSLLYIWTLVAPSIFPDRDFS
ncbi:TMS membrane protein/tumor differentially protein (macronuclear) [Tetrahymena thermophila SB210]|uniref:TMS membrane protein/tumor differentially protein n=1 Tax=Tetrahymena thermophila (strain SB210) TaxID=312017 RepID=Q22U62_TETTS|nr:TMS membrane protein/tumor differentially protein [Tetrahymena thermophila SB210]EAR88825.1 TMS membrane protein/tumor differentially protein [Tetrahymena thermophila SB210]|eukprot:XP_001009070.1 TMS membrane protein/tumor differentially protein [Tetrahymena thermophila SB210]